MLLVDKFIKADGLKFMLKSLGLAETNNIAAEIYFFAHNIF